MTTPTLSAQAMVVPTGGAVLLSISETGSAGFQGLTINRSTNGGPFTQIYAGGPTSLFLDVGETLNVALDPTLPYTYQVLDSNTPSVSTQTAPVTPSSQMTLIPDFTTETLRRLLQSGVASIVAPAGYTTPQFLVQMPLESTPKLPFVTMNLDLVQQEEVPIGLGIPMENFTAESLAPSGTTAVWTVQGLQNRRYSFHLLTRTYKERDFFESAIVGILYGLQTMFTQANMNIRFNYQCTQGAVEGDEAQPGFYFSQIMMDVTSVAMTQISAIVGAINTLAVQAIAPGSSTTATLSGTGLLVQT